MKRKGEDEDGEAEEGESDDDDSEQVGSWAWVCVRAVKVFGAWREWSVQTRGPRECGPASCVWTLNPQISTCPVHCSASIGEGTTRKSSFAAGLVSKARQFAPADVAYMQSVGIYPNHCVVAACLGRVALETKMCDHNPHTCAYTHANPNQVLLPHRAVRPCSKTATQIPDPMCLYRGKAVCGKHVVNIKRQEA